MKVFEVQYNHEIAEITGSVPERLWYIELITERPTPMRMYRIYSFSVHEAVNIYTEVAKWKRANIGGEDEGD